MIEKYENKKKVIRTQFINDLLSVDEFRNMNEELENMLIVQRKKLSELDKKIEDNSKTFSFDDIKDIVSNIKLNWEYLNNKERRQFLEQFVEEIDVEKKDGKVLIKNVEFKR